MHDTTHRVVLCLAAASARGLEKNSVLARERRLDLQAPVKMEGGGGRG